MYVPRKDLVKAVQVALDNAKREGGESQTDMALIEAVEALLALVENDAK
jgi:hypothetical protein